MKRTRAAGVMVLFMFSFSLLPYPLIAEGVDFYRDLLPEKRELGYTRFRILTEEPWIPG